MKFNPRNRFLIILGLCAALSSCITTTTTTTAPDGTVTVTKTSGPDAASVAVAGGVITVATKIIAEK